MTLVHFSTTSQRFARTLMRSTGLFGCLSIAFLILSVLLSLFALPRAHQALNTIDNQMRIKVEPTREIPTKVGEKDKSVQDSFPPFSNNAKDLTKLFELAESNGITSSKGDYRLSNATSSYFITYEVRIPVRAAYIDLRRFTSEALSQLPNLALDGIRFTRSESTNETLEAELRLVLFYRK